MALKIYFYIALMVRKSARLEFGGGGVFGILTDWCFFFLPGMLKRAQAGQ